jgi:hypothetical protein
VLRGKFAGDMSHCPSKVSNATKALPRAFYFRSHHPPT